MRIDNYRFGSIQIEGDVYQKDVIIFPDEVYSPWWRRTGHNLEIDDLAGIFEYEPELIIIGTGAYGVMEVPQSTIDIIKEKDIEVKIFKTKEAVNEYNEAIKEGRNVIACLHLTC
ncbi:hypothetical protein KAW48_02095 [candidate division WOR-3 bacterium]|nr:hypothetical protein [candidate division WOR-3 bacterium]